MERSMRFKTINRSVFFATSLLIMTVAFTSPVHAAVVVPTPVGGVYIGGTPSYYGYGYRHGYGYGYGAAGYHSGYGYGHGTGYHNGYHGNTAYHHGNGHGTVVHNGNVHHYNRR